MTGRVHIERAMQEMERPRRSLERDEAGEFAPLLLAVRDFGGALPFREMPRLAFAQDQRLALLAGSRLDRAFEHEHLRRAAIVRDHAKLRPEIDDLDGGIGDAKADRLLRDLRFQGAATQDGFPRGGELQRRRTFERDHGAGVERDLDQAGDELQLLPAMQLFAGAQRGAFPLAVLVRGKVRDDVVHVGHFRRVVEGERVRRISHRVRARTRSPA